MLDWLKSLGRRWLPAPLAHRYRIARHIYLQPVEAELRWLHKSALQFDLAVDVGANLGLYSQVLSARSARVLTIEPIPELADYLARVLPANCTVHNTALSDQPGQAALRIPLDHRGKRIHGSSTIAQSNDFAGSLRIKGHQNITVPCQRLDDLVLALPDAAQVGFVKIDVEGHELAVLQGARQILAQHRPLVLLETEIRHGADIAALFALFGAYGYRGNILVSGDLRAISGTDFIARQTAAQHGTPEYINNLLFTPDPAAPDAQG